MKSICIPSFMSVGTIVIELREFNNKKNMDKMGKIVFLADIKCFFNEIFGT